MVRVLVTALVLLVASVGSALAQPIESFDAFKQRFRAVAIGMGVSASTYDAAIMPLEPDASIVSLISGQPEFTTPVWDYLDQRITSSRISRGQAAYAANRSVFEAIGAATGVDPYILAAIWGVETDYGAALANTGLIKPILRSLATVAHQRRGRVAEDEAELIAALQLVEIGRFTAEGMVGSWAGAVGHLQVIPTGLITYGADGDGDGRIDPHTSLADALMTSARYLRGLGYQPGLDWGFEVTVPAGFDYLLADRTQMRPISFFAERGVARIGGRGFADSSTPVFLYAPAGQGGPHFLMTANYLVLKGYNFSDSYALSVAHLTDRLKGAGGFAAPWPRSTTFPNRAERIAIQQGLWQLGYYSGAVDGNIGPVSQAAFARFQADRGIVADGFITRDAVAMIGTALQ